MTIANPKYIDSLRFMVTQTDIDMACKEDKKNCMIALALKRKLIEKKIDCANTVEVDLGMLRFTDRTQGIRYTFLQTPQGQVQLALFDRGEEIKPFEMKLSKPFAGPMHKYRKEYKKPVEIDVTKRGRPSVHGVKRFAPRTIPATLHSSKRRYSANALATFWGEKKLPPRERVADNTQSS